MIFDSESGKMSDNIEIIVTKEPEVNTTKAWITKKYSEGIPEVNDFKCIDVYVPECEYGDIIIEALAYSVDPYQRNFMRRNAIGTILPGSQIAKVIESNNNNYSLGSLVVAYPGWRSVSRITRAELEDRTPRLMQLCRRAPDFGDLPISYGLGVLGMPGITAYFGFLEICKPQPGDITVVNSAAGAVGSIVCQIAKIKGCTVIAFAGSDAKVNWVETLAVDYVFNYKEVEVGATLSKYAPNGVNCYFDNVGGRFSAEVLPHMATFGRVSICGHISTYNDESKSNRVSHMDSPFAETTILHSQLQVEGFLCYRWMDEWDEGLKQLKEWIDEGKIVYKETIHHGFSSLPEAFRSLFEGDHMGKVVVKP